MILTTISFFYHFRRRYLRVIDNLKAKNWWRSVSMAKIVVSLACSLLLVSSAVCASDMNATEFQSPSQTPGTESASALASSTQSDPSGHNATATTSTIIMDALAASSKRMTTFTAISGTTSETLTETFYTTKPATSVSNSGDEIASLGSHLGSTDGTGRTTMLLVNILNKCTNRSGNTNYRTTRFRI